MAVVANQNSRSHPPFLSSETILVEFHHCHSKAIALQFGHPSKVLPLAGSKVHSCSHREKSVAGTESTTFH